MVHNYKEIYYVNPKHNYIKTYTDLDKQLVHYKRLNKNMDSIGNIITLKLADFKKFTARNKYSITYVKGREYKNICKKCNTEFIKNYTYDFCDICHKKAMNEITQEMNNFLAGALKND